MNHIFVGILLIGIGLLSFLGNMGIVTGDFFLILVGAAFLGFYFASQKPVKPLGLLIPGCITLAIGVFSNLEYLFGPFDGPAFFFLLGFSFLAIHGIHTTFSHRSKPSQWALIVGICLMAFGGFILSTTFMDYAPFRFILQNMWPAGLIFGGLLLIFVNKDKSQDTPTNHRDE